DRHETTRERRQPDPGAGRGEGRPPRGRRESSHDDVGRSRPAAARRAHRRRAARPARGDAHADPVGRLEADPQARLGREQGRQHAHHRRRGGVLRFPLHLPGVDRAHLALRPGRLPGDGGPAGGGSLRTAAGERRGPDRRSVERDRRQQRQRAEHQPRRVHPRRPVECVRGRGQRDHGGEPRLRRGRGAGVRQAQAHVAGAHPRRHRLRPGDLRPGRGRPRGHRGAALRRHRHVPRPGGPVAAPAGGVRRCPRRALPHRARPGRPPVQLGQSRCRRRHPHLGTGQRRLQRLRGQLRVLRQDLRRDRRRHRAHAVAVPHLFPGAARRGDQLRGRAPDGARHDHRGTAADGEPRRDDGRHAARLPRAAEGRQRPHPEM
ncbi:MAG: Ribonuclease BN, partial [uncultured Blastococcus sp.]